MSTPVRKWATFVLRWGIAVAGIWWVVANLSLRDRITILDQNNLPRQATLAQPATEDARWFVLADVDPATGQPRRVPRQDTVNQPEKKQIPLRISTAEGEQTVQLLALSLSDDLKRVQRLLVSDPATGGGKWIEPRDVVGGYQLRVPHPRVEVGLASMIRRADPSLLLLAILIFPITFIITSVRWNALLKTLGIFLPQTRTFVLNMVGFFYSTFMPGSTGGDLLKAYYASKQTPHRTQAVLSVFIDRVIGLLALIVLGGAMAAYQYASSTALHDPAVLACKRVAAGSVFALAAVLAGVGLFALSPLRRALGVDYLISRLPLQKHVQHAVQVGRIYRDKPGIIIWALLVTLPVHMTVVVSAVFAGKAFGLPMPAMYYFVAVPVIVLSGALPISPQGAGVMEFFAIQLTKQYGVTVSQAFALTMSIRLVQILWNLTGGIFVLRGGYHAPSQREQEELEIPEQPGHAAQASPTGRHNGDGSSIANAKLQVVHSPHAPAD